MGKPTGFLEFEREPSPSRDALVRLNDYYEIYERAGDRTLREQGARCMDCGVPFCQCDTGCPIDNLIPEFNDLVYQRRWKDAYHRLVRTNNFPEFTGRICPAPCESACVLGITDPAVTIKSIECAIIDKAFEENWVVPRPPKERTGKRVAVVGSGPAGLAAADQLNKAGHHVTVFERDDRIGGLLMYGVPNMKLDKQLVQRRVDLLAAEGIEFRTNCNIADGNADTDAKSHHGMAADAELIDAKQLQDDFDAVLLACGALRGRDLDRLPGREFKGVHMAMTYLHKSTKSLLDSQLADGDYLDAKDKNVIVIGGGDTGTDCIATALRQGCASITNITRREREPDERDENHPWPGPTGTYFIDYGHAEGIAKFDRDPRRYNILPKAFIGDADGNLTHMRVSQLEWTTPGTDTPGTDADNKPGRKESREIPGSEQDLPADYVFLSIGFTGHDTPAVFARLGVATEWGNAKTKEGHFATNVPGVFAAGDVRRGASLVVWAIAEGRGAARAIDTYLMDESTLPAPGVADVESQMMSSAG
ncbi:glutamate synthase subunit beta [Phycisphaeraceae bacterium D3-23]